MGQGVITVDDKDIVVREDKWKAHRGVKWALISIFVFVAIVATLFVFGMLTASRDGDLDSPAAASNAQANNK